MKRTNILLDCDPGMDDSMAILMAVKSHQLSVKAITTVNGNYPVDVTSRNARKILEMLGAADIPVGQGLAAPLVRPSPPDPFTHGTDGQGENFLPDPALPLADQHGVDLIIDTVKKYAGEIVILATGPLSNIAMALRKAPEIKEMITGIYAISGAFGLNEDSYRNATGDSPQSEWNVFVDPEAADLVYNAGIHFVALGLDVAAHSQVSFTPVQISALHESGNQEARFLAQAIRFVEGRGYSSYCAVIDCMAVAYAIDPGLLKTMRGKVGIETQGLLTRGNTVLDRRRHHARSDLAEITIGVEADFAGFLSLVMDLVLA